MQLKAQDVKAQSVQSTNETEKPRIKRTRTKKTTPEQSPPEQAPPGQALPVEATPAQSPPEQAQPVPMSKIREKIERILSKDVESFVERFVHIEDRDAPGIIVEFRLWKAQKEALRSIDEHRLNIILKARQLGMTWLGLAYTAWKMLFCEGYTVIGLSKTEPDAKELVRRLGIIFKYMPELIYDKKEAPPDWTGRTYRQSSLGIEVCRPDSIPSTFDAFTSAPSAGRSFTANLVLIDEWAFQQFAYEIWTAAFPTINRPTGGKVIGISTIERGTLFEEIFTGDRGFNKIFIPWNADPRRTSEWYEVTRQAMGELIMQEYPATVEEALAIPGGTFFPDVKGHVHLKPRLERTPKHYRRYVCIDYGRDMLAAHWVYMDEQNNARIYREADKEGLTISEAAEFLLQENRNDEIELWLAPPDLWNARQETGKSAADIFRENGITLTKTSNNRQNGCLALLDWLRPLRVKDEFDGSEVETARLTIDEGCAPSLWKSLTKIQKNPAKPNEYANMPHDLTHDVDSLRCFAVYWTHPASSCAPSNRIRWTADMWEDYHNTDKIGKQYLLNKFGPPA